MMTAKIHNFLSIVVDWCMGRNKSNGKKPHTISKNVELLEINDRLIIEYNLDGEMVPFMEVPYSYTIDETTALLSAVTNAYNRLSNERLRTSSSK